MQRYSRIFLIHEVPLQLLSLLILSLSVCGVRVWVSVGVGCVCVCLIWSPREARSPFIIPPPLFFLPSSSEYLSPHSHPG